MADAQKIAAKKGFDLAGLMKSVSNLNTQEQIEYLPFALLDPDPRNQYSMDGLEGLADSIATVGLVHPLRVRQQGERYTVTSGHRRLRSIQLLIDDGDTSWLQGTPCIVDHGESLPEFYELKLIFANNQRQKISAELSREAERTEQLLVALKKKGYEFPGRMQDHVAQALNVNASKLKRLHAIRSNAQPPVLKAYDAGEINESVAYEFSKIPPAVQLMYMRQREKACMRLDIITAEEVRSFHELYCKLRGLRCKAAGCNCPRSGDRILEALRQLNGVHDATDSGKPFGYGNCTKGKCCLGCKELLNCEAVRCKYTAPEVKAREEAEEQRAKAFQEAYAQRQEAFDRARQQSAEANAAIWSRIRRAARENGADLEEILDNYADDFDSLSNLVDFANGRSADYHNAASGLLEEDLETLADALNCSTDFLLGRTEEVAVNRGMTPAPATLEQTLPQWQHGEPAAEGWYACLGVWANIPERLIAYWRDGAWYEEESGRRTMTDTEIKTWYPLPGLPDLSEEV